MQGNFQEATTVSFLCTDRLALKCHDSHEEAKHNGHEERKQNTMVGRRRLILLIGGHLAIAMVLASCGQNFRSTSGSPADSSGTPVQLSPTIIRSTGGVVLHVDAVPQQGSDTISITLANQTNQAILFPDHLTECTVILLQLIAQGVGNGQWQAVAPCRREMQTQLHMLAPGKNLTITLTSPSGQWVPGLYRASLTYFLSETRSTSKTVFSFSFPVGSFNPCQRTEIACQASPGP